MVSDGKSDYSLVILRREVEQAHFDLEFAAITGNEQLQKEKSMLGIVRTILIVLYRLAIFYHRLQKVKRLFNKTERKQDKAIAKAAKHG